MKKKNGTRTIFLLLLLALVAVSVFMVIWMFNRENTSENSGSHTDVTRVQMSWWGNDGRHMYTMKGVDLFQEKNPEIAVAYRYGEWNGYEKRNKVWMKSHNAADVMQINYAWLNEYSKDGEGYYDLNTLSEYIDLDNFTEEELSYGMQNGKLNALPIAMNTHTFYYNQDILEENGLSVPETWDDLFAMAKVLGPQGKYVLGFSKKQMFLLLISYYEQSTGKRFFNDDGTLAIDEAGITGLLELYKKLIDEKVVCPVDSFDRTDYMSGKIVGTMCWISDTKLYCDAPLEAGVNVSHGSYPKLPGATTSGWYIKPATMWAISVDTEHPEEAAKLLNYLLNDPEMAKLQKNEKGVPVSKAAVAALKEEGLLETNEYKAIQEMNEKQGELKLIIPNMENERIIDAFKIKADEYLYDKMSVSQCATETRKAMQAVIDGAD